MSDSTEKRFQKAVIDMNVDRETRLADIERDQNRRAAERSRKKKTRRNWALGVSATGLTVAVTALAFGHETLGQGVRNVFGKDAPPATSPYQLEKNDQAHAQNSGKPLEGEPLVTDQH